MMPLTELIREGLQTAFRMLPWPTEPGLRAIGSPGAGSPVLVTGNYDLTVRRVTRALRGVDAWLVVAPSGGINVWCAAAGGLLSTPQVVTALKTSGVEGRVTHRRVILPQLAATGVRAVDLSRRCGWKARFGPVYAEDLPAYLDAGEKKTDSMRRARFSLGERLEMAAAWAAPVSVVAGAIGWLVQAGWGLAAVVFVWALALSAFGFYDRLPEPRRWIIVGGGTLGAFLVAWVLGAEGLGLATAPLAAACLAAVITFDFDGSSPTRAPAGHDGADWRIALDLERCKGVYSCWAVCPEACFEKRETERKVELAHDERCIRCGACVVQCPVDALSFEDETGHRIEPETIRRFKLNLLGRRVVSVRAGDG